MIKVEYDANHGGPRASFVLADGQCFSQVDKLVEFGKKQGFECIIPQTVETLDLLIQILKDTRKEMLG